MSRRICIDIWEDAHMSRRICIDIWEDAQMSWRICIDIWEGAQMSWRICIDIWEEIYILRLWRVLGSSGSIVCDIQRPFYNRIFDGQ